MERQTKLPEFVGKKIVEALKQDEEAETKAFSRGFKEGTIIGARAERRRIIGYLENKTAEEVADEFITIPYLGETREEKPEKET